jgi:hypothetical protein
MMSLLPRHLRFVVLSLALSVGYVAALHIRFRASASDTNHLRQPLSHCDHRMTRILPTDSRTPHASIFTMLLHFHCRN